MAVTILLSPQPEVQETESEASLEAQVDQHAALLKQVALSKLQLKLLNKQVEESLASLAENEVVASVLANVEEGAKGILEGEEHTLSITPGALRPTLEDVAGAREILGDDTFMKAATIPIGVLREYLTPEELDELCSFSRNKPTIKAV